MVGEDISLKDLPAYAVLVWIVIQGIIQVIKVVRGKGDHNGASGEKDPNYWKMAFRDIVEEALKRHDHNLKEVVISAVRDELRRWR